MSQQEELTPFTAVVLAGGEAVRLDGADKASVELHGRTLLTWALDAVVDASEVVVVGDPVPTHRPVTFTREDPRHGGPVAALLTGRDELDAANAELIAALRVSPEGQEGIAAFLEKRPPAWIRKGD